MRRISHPIFTKKQYKLGDNFYNFREIFVVTMIWEAVFCPLSHIDVSDSEDITSQLHFRLSKIFS